MGRVWLTENPDINATFTNLTIVDKIKLIANFRRIESEYKENPNFGFDWMRESYLPLSEKGGGVCIKGIDDLKKIYTPCVTAEDFTKGEPLKIDNQAYYVPWFCGFAKDKEGLQGQTYKLYIEFKNGEPKGITGKVFVKSEDNSITLEFDETEENNFPVTQQKEDFKKTVKLTFNDYLTQDTLIEVYFIAKGTNEKEILGFLNVNKNNIEYQLNAKYVNVSFTGKKIKNNTKAKEEMDKNLINFEARKRWDSFSINALSQSLIRYENITIEETIKTEMKYKDLDISIFFNLGSAMYVIKKNKDEFIDTDKFIKKIKSLYKKKEKLQGEVISFLLPFNLALEKGFSFTAGTLENLDKKNQVCIATPITKQEPPHVILHEILHTNGLKHYFDDDNDISFIQSLTDNIMDYPKITEQKFIDIITEKKITKERILNKLSISKKQWDLLHEGDPNLETIKKK